MRERWRGGRLGRVDGWLEWVTGFGAPARRVNVGGSHFRLETGVNSIIVIVYMLIVNITCKIEPALTMTHSNI